MAPDQVKLFISMFKITTISFKSKNNLFNMNYSHGSY